MSALEIEAGQRLLTPGLMIYEVLSVGERVSFKTEGFDGVRCVDRKQWERLVKGARVVSPARATTHEAEAGR